MELSDIEILVLINLGHFLGVHFVAIVYGFLHLLFENVCFVSVLGVDDVATLT